MQPKLAVMALHLPAGWRGEALPTYEDADWSKPSYCARYDRLTPSTTWCDRDRLVNVDEKKRVIAYLTWKAGSTSLSNWWACAFANARKRGFDWFTHPSTAHRLSERRFLAVGQAREPVGRVVSAYLEILTRLTVRVRLDEVVGDAAIRLPDPRRFGAQVGGAHAQMGRMRADFERTFGAIRRSHADWLLAGWEGTVRDEDELRASGRLDERERFGAYLRAVACAAIFHEWPHHQTASGFMAASRIANSSEHVSTIGPRQLGANGCGRMIARPAPSIDVLLRQESFVMDMHALGERLGINMTRCPVGHSKDALERFNSAMSKRKSGEGTASQRKKPASVTTVPAEEPEDEENDAQPSFEGPKPCDDATRDRLSRDISRMLLFSEHTKKGLTRADIKKAVMADFKDSRGKVFDYAFAYANQVLKDTFGFEIAPAVAKGAALEPDAGTQRDGEADAEERLDKAGPHKFFLVSTLQRKTPLGKEQPDDAHYRALVCVVIGAVRFASNSLTETRLWDCLRVLGLDKDNKRTTAAFGGSLEDLVLKRMTKDMYIHVKSAPEQPREISEGLRARSEVPPAKWKELLSRLELHSSGSSQTQAAGRL